jgi:hypothetical protein
LHVPPTFPCNNIANGLRANAEAIGRNAMGDLHLRHFSDCHYAKLIKLCLAVPSAPVMRTVPDGIGDVLALRCPPEVSPMVIVATAIIVSDNVLRRRWPAEKRHRNKSVNRRPIAAVVAPQRYLKVARLLVSPRLEQATGSCPWSFHRAT